MIEEVNHSTITAASQSNIKEGREFLLTPIFKYELDDNGTSYSSISKSKNTNSSPGIENDKRYKRKIIDRIVTSIPFDHSHLDHKIQSTGNEKGDVEVCIEEYYKIQSNFNSLSFSPILRRVTVRSYVGQAEDDHVGLIHASFSLPIGQLPRNIMREERGGGRKGNAMSKNWICWTKFAPSYSSHNDYGASGRDTKQQHADNIIENDTLSQLCVLTSPTTLKIYDVFSKQKGLNRSSITGNACDKDDGYMSKGEGHTISLPFEASSIFSLPSPYSGLFIQRADNGNEEVFMTHDDYCIQQQQQQQQHQKQQPQPQQRSQHNYHNQYHQQYSASNDNDGNIMSSPPPIPPPAALLKDDFVIEGPPTTVRLGINNSTSKLQPRPSEPLLLDNQGPGNNIDLGISVPTGIGSERKDTLSPTPSFASSDFGVGVAPPNANDQERNPMAPSLYTLHHPLDDILPCVFSSPDNDVNTKSNDPKQPSVWRQTNVNRDSILHFANVFEQIIYVGKPRSFRSKDEVVIVVTYHTRKKTHSVWVINDAPSSITNVPLWQQTSWAFHDTLNLMDIPKTSNNTFGTNNKDEDVIMTDETKMNENYLDYNNNCSNYNQTATSFLFTQLTARVALRCIHIIHDPVNIQGDTEDISLLDSVTSIESVASEIFLATTPNEDGDYLLCLLQRLSNPTDIENENLLRCFTLKKERNAPTSSNQSQWSITHSNDIQCVAALPISTTPINPPSFLPLELSPDIQELATKWRKNYSFEPPLAKDIFIFKHYKQNEKLRILRGDVKIADCSVPTSGQDIFNENILSVSNLQYAVGDRLDILYKSYGDRILAVRVSLSLLSKSSPIAEKSLLAIGSALLPPLSDEVSDTVLNKSSMPILCCAFRADFAISSQLTSSIPEAQELVDDVEWYVCSSLIASFFAFALNRDSTWDVLSSLQLSKEDNMNVDTYGDEAWNALLQSQFHMEYYDMNGKNMLLTSLVNESSSLTHARRNLDEKWMQSFFASSCVHWLSNNTEIKDDLVIVCSRIFDALHFLYEDMKLGTNSGCENDARRLGNLLYHLSSRCQSVDNEEATKLMDDFEGMYSIDLWNKTKVMHLSFPDVYFPQRVTLHHEPPSFFHLLEKTIHHVNRETSEWQLRTEKMILNGICSSMGTILRFFNIYFDKKWGSTIKNNFAERDRCVVLAMISEGFNNPNEFLEKFPLSVASILLEVCHRCRSDPAPISNRWPTLFYNFLGRADLAKIQGQFFPMGDGEKFLDNEHRGAAQDSLLITQSFSKEEDEDGLALTEKCSAMLFPNDNRVREAAKLLRSSRPTFLRVQRQVETSDHDYERQKQERLSLICRRIAALPIGRGMLTNGTLQSLPAEQLSIPPLCMAGRIPPRMATLTIEGSQWTPEMKTWPEFHNGVAAGLRLPIPVRQDGSDDNKILEIARTWIVYNKPSQNSTEVQNNIVNNNNQVQNPPQPNHAHGGFLMALGLRGHLSALSMTDICDYLAKGAVTTTTAVGILLGMAATKRGTCDPSISKMLCLHTPSLLPSSFSSIDVRSPTQAAAITGIGLLYQNSSHRLMTEFLLNEIGKRPTNEQNISDRESYSLCCGMALGMVNLGLKNGNKNKSGKNMIDDMSDLRIEDRLLRYIVGGVDESYIKQKNDQSNNINNINTNDSERCSRIYEGDVINTDITAPGALLALGLMYIQSGNKSIANQLALPDTKFELDNIRPDFLFLRIVARSIVLWDEVESTPDWIDKQMPVFIQNNYAILKSKLEKETQNEYGRINIDTKAMKEAHIYITAGACFSLGLIFAGTGNAAIRDSIIQKVVQIQRLRDDSDPISMLLRPQRPVVEMCLGAAAIALSLVMAGTGDLKSLRLLKILRWKCDDGVNYGNHMSYATAIGILFLGGGACTFGRDPEDIAAMLLAFFPRYPVSSQDNQYHLQALRHMYVLAVKPRRIDAIDIDSNEKTIVPIKIEYEGSESIETRTPCLLLNRGRLMKISIISDRYYPVEVDYNAFTVKMKPLQLYVKRKSGCISYVEDPYGLRSSFFLSVARHRASMLDLINFTAEAKDLQVYAKYLCIDQENQYFSLSSSPEKNSLPAFCNEILYESLVEAKTASIPLQLAIYDAIATMKKKGFHTKSIWDIRILRSLFEVRENYEVKGSFQILGDHFIASVCQHLDKILQEYYVMNMGKESFQTCTFGPRRIWCRESN